MKWIKKIILYGVIIGIIAIVVVLINNRIVINSTQDLVYNSTSDIPHHKVGLLLGTSKHNRYGGINLYYKYRIAAAVKLFKAGKIDYILVSGDNGSKGYDEPTSFKEDLIKEGIPADKIILDYAGFRTLDSILRAKNIFGQNEITVISQQFHNERAIYIAKRNGMKAVGFNAKNPQGAFTKRIVAREYLARTKMMLDLLLNKQPKFYGEKIKIG